MKYAFGIRTSYLAPGTMQTVEIEGHKILLANIDGTYYALPQRCTHFGADLCDPQRFL